MQEPGQNFIKLLRDGKISEETVLLYGISGHLIDQDDYYKMSIPEREYYWENKIKSRLGNNWRRLFSKLPAFLSVKEKVDWLTTGF